MENTSFAPMSWLAIWCSSPKLFSVSEPGPPAKAVTAKPDGEARIAAILNNARGPTGGVPVFLSSRRVLGSPHAKPILNFHRNTLSRRYTVGQ